MAGTGKYMFNLSKKEAQRVAKSNGKRTRLCKMWMGKYYIAKFYI